MSTEKGAAVVWVSSFGRFAIGIAFSTVIVGFAFFYSIYNSAHLAGNYNNVTQYYRLALILESINLELSENESALRGFIITDEDRYLKDFEVTEKRMNIELEELKSIVATLPEESVKANSFDSLIRFRAQILDSCALLKENGRCDAEGLNALVRKGEVYMDKIRILKSSMEADLDHDFTGREIDALKTFRNDRLALLFSGLAFLFIVGLVLFILSNDFKQRNRLEKELRALNLNKNKFFSIISHDLRGPVHGISRLATFLKNKDTPREDVLAMGAVIEETSNRVSGLLENLLTWSRIQMNRVEYRPEHFDILPLIDECIKDMQALSRLKSIQIMNQVNSVRVFADRNMIQTVIRNLLSNSIKFSHSGGKVLITASVQKEILTISVSDKGIGIPESVLSELFKIEGTQTSRGTADETGTGLGLLLCREFLEKNDGSISVESSEADGTVFQITLPLNSNH